MSTYQASSALIVDADNNLLVLRRGGTHPWAPHQPDLPGGVIEKNETHLDGLAREILEEIGLEIAAEKLKEAGITTHHDFFFVHTIEHSFYAYRFVERPAVVLSWEHDDHEWIPISEVKGLEKPVQRALEKIIVDGFFEKL